MSVKRRLAAQKLNTLLFGKDIRVTGGNIFSDVYEYDFSSYLPTDKYICAQLPCGDIYDIRKFGAIPKKDIDNTAAVQSAIDKCFENGGGTVLVSGGEYIIHTIIIKSNTCLFVEKGSALTASVNPDGYKNQALIFADNGENIEITGGGKICGNGNFFSLKPIEPPETMPSEVIDVIEMRREYRKRIRFAHKSKYGRLCTIKNCRVVSVHNIIFENSASWTLNINCCENVKINNIMINNNRHIANSDGIDIVGSNNVDISKCFISTGDDGICLKNAIWLGCTKDMSNIHISGCEVISCTNSFKIGTETTFDIHNVTIENCSFLMTDLYPGSVSGISIEACDGSKVYDVKVSNITMDRVSCPLFIRLGNRNRAAEVDRNTYNATELKIDTSKKSEVSDKKMFDFKSEIHDISAIGITATNIELPIIITGVGEVRGTKYVESILLKDFDLTYRNCRETIDRRMFIPEYAKVYPESWRFRNLPSYALFLRHIKKIKIQNFKCTPAPHSWKKAEYTSDVE